MATVRSAGAQTDEIEVYTGSIAARHELTIALHTNYVIDGDTVPAFPGAVVANHSLNGVPEFSYGVTDWFEAGLYLPVWSADAQSGLGYDGFKLRAEFVAPHGDSRKFAYGVNLEFSVNEPRWTSSRYGGEVRGILAWHLPKIDLILNPIFELEFEGAGSVDFNPCWRADYNASERWSFALEQYSEFGPVDALYAASQQVHQLYAVVDHKWSQWEVELGLGKGLTSASDQWTVKLIIETTVGGK